MSRGTWDTARAFLDFTYRAITFYGRLSHAVQLSSKVPHRGPATLCRIATAKFRLIRFRSPLLSESRFLYIPGGTKMFQFPPFALYLRRVIRLTTDWVLPFGNPRIKVCLTTPRGLSQPTTSFIAVFRQGIHPIPLVA